jgi:hypothetical protein
VEVLSISEATPEVSSLFLTNFLSVGRDGSHIPAHADEASCKSLVAHPIRFEFSLEQHPLDLLRPDLFHAQGGRG